MDFFKKYKILLAVIMLLVIILVFGLLYYFFIIERVASPGQIITDIPNNLEQNFLLSSVDRFQKNEEKKLPIPENTIYAKYYDLTVEDCDKIIDQDLKNTCLLYFSYDEIIASKDLNKCGDLEGEWRDICIYDILIQDLKDWEKCSLINNEIYRDNCYEKHAINQEDGDICSNMGDSSKECRDRATAVNTKADDSILRCKTIETAEYFERCVNLVADQPCEDLEEQPIIDKCKSWRFFDSILLEGIKADCAILPIENFQKVCEIYFDNDKQFVDSDNDGIFDNHELLLSKDPFNNTDGEEALRHLKEEDRMNIIGESIKYQTFQALNDLRIDTDDDGLRDYEEKEIYKTNYQVQDTDGDGFLDGEEVQNGYNPNGAGRL